MTTRLKSHQCAYTLSALALMMTAVPAILRAQGPVRAKAWAFVNADGTLNVANSYNSSGATITVTRTGTGVYRLVYTGLGSAVGNSGGISHVSSANPLARCKSQNGTVSADLYTDEVRCRDTAGADMDSAFTVMYYRESRQSLTAWYDAYLFNDQNTPAGEYTPPAYWGWNSRGGVNTVTRTGVGLYSVKFGGLSGAPHGGDVQVTGSGFDNAYCSVINWVSNAPDEFANVECFAPNGNPMDTHFAVSFISDVAVAVNVASDPTSGAYVWANLPNTFSYTPSSSYSLNSTGGTNTITRQSTGRYTVNFPGLSAASDRTIPLVTAYGGPTSCTVGTVTQASNGGSDVTVACNDGATAADSYFAIRYFTSKPSAILSISKFHAGSFTQGQNSATYTIRVGNLSTGPTFGTVTVTDTLPAGLTLVSMAGTGWTCAGNTCTRSDALGVGNYPDITVTVNVAGNAASPQVNSATVSGGGSLSATITDSTTIQPKATLSITKSHTGSFVQGFNGAIYTVTVSNAAGAVATSGTVTVTETVPSGMTLVSMAGTGWTCAGNTCTRSNALAGGSSYPPITVTVNVSPLASSPQVNSVMVSGGGSDTKSTTDSTTILPAAEATSVSPNSGSGFFQFFNATYTAGGGFNTLRWVQLLFAVAADGGGQSYCFVHYDVQGNGFWLYGDGGFFVGPKAPFTASNGLQNSLCALNTAQASATGSGTTLTISAPLVFKSGGARNIYMRALSVSGVDTGWVQRGTWTATVESPGPMNVSPAAGTGTTQTFTLSYPNPIGFTATAYGWVQFLVAASVNGGGQPFCYVHYDRAGNGLWMYSSDVGYFLGPVAPGVASNLLNSSACSVNTAGVTVLDASNLMLSVPITFKAPMGGAKTTFLRSLTVLNRDTDWQLGGTWTIP